MPASIVSNPDSAYRVVSDYRTMKDASGEGLAVGSDVQVYQAGGTITVGDIVALVPATSATVPMRVIRKVTARKFASVVGVVRDIGGAGTGAAGDTVSVVTSGLAFVNVGSGTPAAGDNCLVQGNSHEGGIDTAEATATLIAGTVLGTYLGTKDANNLAPVYINHH